jgi:hypothetical protein
VAFIADLIEKDRHPNTDAWARLSDSTHQIKNLVCFACSIAAGGALSSNTAIHSFAGDVI